MKEEIQRYLDANRYKLSLEANWEKFRFACIDSESTGLDPRKDKIVSIAGVGLANGEICLWDQLNIILPVAYNTSSVTVHGITREESVEGVQEPVALARFLDWLRDGIIVGHHIQHDIILLNKALEEHHGFQLGNIVVDTMESYLTLKENGAFPALKGPEGYSLDALCELFQLVPHDRHTALGDAFLTSQILLRILKEAGKRGQWNLSDLHGWYADGPFPFGDGE